MADKKMLFIFGIFIAILMVIGIILSMSSNSKKSTNVLRIGDREYQVEIAESLIDKAKGLSNRTSLADDDGMLFVFSSSTMQSFWMHGMLIPLDFVWINAGRVIGVTENVSASSTDVYNSPSPANMVLEVNVGVVKKDGIKVGDVVVLK